jgi:hypothetical protein
VPQVGSVPRRRVGNFFQGDVAVHSRTAVGIPLIRARPANILRVLRDPNDVRTRGTRLGD